MNQPSPHLCEATLAALAAGLLPDDARVDARGHLQACAGCTERWTNSLAGREAEGADERHLPAAMIARWDRARAHLRGVERELVRQHLERCAACRDELLVVGHAHPVSDLVDSAIWAAPGAPGASSGGPADRPARHRAAGDRSVRWSLPGVAGGLALAAVLVFALLGPWDLGGHLGGLPEDHHRASGVVPWVAPGQFRGDPARVALPAGARAVSLLVGVPGELDVQRPAAVTVTGPGGAVRLEATVRPSDLASGTLVVLLAVSEPLTAGTYVVTLTQDPAAGADPLTEVSTFRITHREPSR